MSGWGKRFKGAPFFNNRSAARWGSMNRFRGRGMRWGGNFLNNEISTRNKQYGMLAPSFNIGARNAVRERGYYEGGLPLNGYDKNRMQSIVGAKGITASYKLYTSFVSTSAPVNLSKLTAVYSYKLFNAVLADTGTGQLSGHVSDSAFLRSTQLRLTFYQPIEKVDLLDPFNGIDIVQPFASQSYRILIAQCYQPGAAEPPIDFFLDLEHFALANAYFAPYNYTNYGRYKIWFDRHIDFRPCYTFASGSGVVVNKAVIKPQSLYMGLSIDFNTKVNYVQNNITGVNNVESNSFYMFIIPTNSGATTIHNQKLALQEMSLFYDF